jgi:hypothetical protein
MIQKPLPPAQKQELPTGLNPLQHPIVDRGRHSPMERSARRCVGPQASDRLIHRQSILRMGQCLAARTGTMIISPHVFQSPLRGLRID